MNYRSERSKIYILSPIPPQPTGTAVYLGFLLRDLQDLIPKENIEIVIDDRYFDEDLPSTFMGFGVTKYSAFMPMIDDILFIFIANNKFHRHCINELVLCRSSKIISFIHDVQICMIMMELCRLKKDSLDENILEKTIGGQLNRYDRRLIAWFKDQSVPEIAKYVTGCQGVTIQNSRIIVVHSYHAAIKLQIEYEWSEANHPKILVMQHPKADEVAEHAELADLNRQKESFTIGLFGWLSKSKRVGLVFNAFESFMDQLTIIDREKVKLRLVGKIIEVDFDVRQQVEVHKYGRNIEFYDYVPKEDFEMLMSECSLLVNLRFPSCGETSGTLIHAETYNIPTVTTAYQSFYEESSTFKISVDPTLEASQLLEVFKIVYDSNKKQIPIKATGPVYPSKLDVKQAFSIILENVA